MIPKKKRIILMIDADNSQAAKIPIVMEDLFKRGTVVLAQAYGNWKKLDSKKWKQVLAQYHIRAIHCPQIHFGKNAADINLAVDAMELLRAKRFDIFALYASDSDYGPLVVKLHEKGKTVIGYGKMNTSASYRNSLDEFIKIDSGEVIEQLKMIVEQDAQTKCDEEGYVNISDLSEDIVKAMKGNSWKVLGYNSLRHFIKSLGEYTIDTRKGLGTWYGFTKNIQKLKVAKCDFQSQYEPSSDKI